MRAIRVRMRYRRDGTTDFVITTSAGKIVDGGYEYHHKARKALRDMRGTNLDDGIVEPWIRPKRKRKQRKPE